MIAKQGIYENRRGELGPFVGADGFAMLALSCLVMVGTGGLTLLFAVVHVMRTGWRAPADVAGATRILVPGYRLPPDGRPNRVYQQRLDRARALARASPHADVFLLGGRARPGVASEAEAGAAWLQARGLAAARLRCEDRSRHTLENLRLYRDAYPPGPNEPAVLVTSRFHLARAALMAAGLGLHCRPCAAEAKPAAILPRLDRVVAEAFLVHWYVVGCRFSHWIGNAHMLARIR
nr:YdcF family protein [uncultured Rhodopila sp.]